MESTKSQKARGHVQARSEVCRTKHDRRKMRLVLEGKCPHCGVACAPFYECEQRRAYKRNKYAHKGNWGGHRRGERRNGDDVTRQRKRSKALRVVSTNVLPRGIFPTERIKAQDDYLGWEKSSPWLLP